MSNAFFRSAAVEVLFFKLRHIGGIINIQKLINGQGPFSELGEEIFDDYWKGYFNKTDAPTADMGSPRYNNLRTYKQYLEQQKGLLKNYNQLTVNGIQNDETIYNIYIKPLINHKAGKANKICQ